MFSFTLQMLWESSGRRKNDSARSVLVELFPSDYYYYFFGHYNKRLPKEPGTTRESWPQLLASNCKLSVCFFFATRLLTIPYHLFSQFIKMNRFTTVSIMIVLVLLATYLKVGSGVYIRFGRSLKTRRTASSARKSEIYTKRETANFANKWMAPARSIRTYR